MDGRRSVDDVFWSDVREAFVLDDDEDIGQLQFPHLAFDDYEINPSVIVPHDANKLKGMYGHLRSAYKVAYANWKKSGTHDSDFGNFCNGQMDVLYLHQFVCLYPEIEVSVASMIPSHIGVSSSDSGTFSNPSTPKSGSRKSKGNEDRVVSLMNALDSSAMRAEVAKKKIESMSDLSAYRNERMKLEKKQEERQAHKFYFDQFDLVSRRIRELLKEAASETSAEIKEEIKDQIALFKKEQAKLKEKMTINY